MTRPTLPHIAVPEYPSEPLSAPLILREKLDQLGAQMLASAQRLATDEAHQKAIQKLLV